MLTNAGFRPVSNQLFYTKVARASIDRPDTTYILKNIPPERLSDYDMLYMFINGVIDPITSEAILERIQKTLSFIDGRTKVSKTVEIMRGQLIELTKDVANPKKRYVRGKGPSVNVDKVVSFYTSYVAEHNQNQRYKEFRKLDSKIYIIIVTTALSTSINIADIKFVFQQKFSYTRDIEYILQQLRRGGRTLPFSKKSVVFLFLPYYIDNRLKTISKGSQAIVPQKRIPLAATIGAVLRSRSGLSSEATLLGKDASTIDDDTNIQVSSKGT